MNTDSKRLCDVYKGIRLLQEIQHFELIDINNYLKGKENGVIIHFYALTFVAHHEHGWG